MASDVLRDMEQKMRMLKITGLVILVALLSGVGYFIWVWFLDPAGKLAWQWPKSFGGEATVVGLRDGELLVCAKDQLLRVQPHKGKQVSSTTLAVTPAGYDAKVELLPDGYLVRDEEGVARLASDGKLLSRVELPEDATFAPDFSVAVYVATDFDRKNPWENWTQSVVCVDLRTGKERWRQPAPLTVGILAVAATSDTVVAATRKIVKVDPAAKSTSFTQAPKGKFSRLALKAKPKTTTSPDAASAAGEGEASASTPAKAATPKADDDEELPGYHVEYKIIAFAAADGKMCAWRVPLAHAPLWGPEVVAGNFVIQQDAQTLAAVTPTGEVAWSTALPAAKDSPTLCTQGGLLLALYDGATLAFDAATGKGLWSVPVPTSKEKVVVTKRAVLFLGSTTRATGIKVSHMQGFDQDPALVKEMGLDQKVSQKSVPLLVCVDRATGDLQWQQEYVRGTLLADEERVVVVAASGESSPMAFFSEGGDTIVQQYAYKTGKMLCNVRTEHLVLMYPTLAGDRVVGCAYDPRHFTTSSTHTVEDSTLTAFHLK